MLRKPCSIVVVSMMALLAGCTFTHKVSPEPATDALAASVRSPLRPRRSQLMEVRSRGQGDFRPAARALALALALATALTAAFLQGCTHVQRVDPKDIVDAQSTEHPLNSRQIARLPDSDATSSRGNSPQRAVVLLRLAVKYEGALLESPFSFHLDHPRFTDKYIRIASHKNERPLRLPFVGFASEDSEQAGWFWLSLEPGSYDFWVRPLIGELEPGVHSFPPGLWGPFRIQVPRDAKLVYGGTLTMDCIKTGRFGLATKVRCKSEQILDEGDLARQVAATSLARFAPPVTALVAPAEEADALLAQAAELRQAGYGMASCAEKPTPQILGQVLGVSVDWRHQEQFKTGAGKQDPKVDARLAEEKLVACFRDALHKAALQVTPIGVSARLDRLDNSASTLQEMNTAIVMRVRDPQVRGGLTASHIRYLVAVQALTGEGIGDTQIRDASPAAQGLEISSTRPISTNVDVLIIDLQEGCLVQEQALAAKSSSTTGVGLVAYILPVPIYMPAGDTEARACEALAQRVADTLSSKR